MINVVGFLQNAWSPLYAGGVWPRESWLNALYCSRTGLKLIVMEAECVDQVDFWWDNITPVVGLTPASILPADPLHIKNTLATQKPAVVVALGRHAAKAIRPVWHGPLMILPHPAYRLVTNDLYRQAGKYLCGKLKPTEIVEVKQARGQVIFLKE